MKVYQINLKEDKEEIKEFVFSKEFKKKAAVWEL